MSDSRVFLGRAVPLANSGGPAQDHIAIQAKGPGDDGRSWTAPEGPYVATSPGGKQLPIPKELFVALADFMKTRKCPGSITIQFRGGEIICVEAVAKKTYRGH
ncbi:MAG TPA: hypothetical protein VIB39_00085 [Candidatus Angelobacter sp.]|jgi:hypothetical protein